MMTLKKDIAPVRILPDDVANKIAAGEVVERPASVVKELVENSLDAGATRIVVRIVAAGRRMIEVLDNGHGMSEQNALLAVERHATSKIRKADDLEAVQTMGFRGEALASIASVSRFVLTTRRAKDEGATRIRVDGGILRDVEQIGAPVGSRVTVNRLYFNTPVRAKFLKGITTELGHCIDVVQRHALARHTVGFQFIHNEKLLLDVPEHANLRERVALIWGLNFVKDMVDLEAEHNGYHLTGLIGLPSLTRAQRSHQFFFMNTRPVVNPSLQYGFQDGYRGMVTVGRHPVGVLLVRTHPRFVDINIHPTKREIRFRDERAARETIRNLVRDRLAAIDPQQHYTHQPPVIEADETAAALPSPALDTLSQPLRPPAPLSAPLNQEQPPQERLVVDPVPAPKPEPETPHAPEAPLEQETKVVQNDLPGMPNLPTMNDIIPEAAYQPVGDLNDAPLQLFDTYLLVPEEDRLLIIDQHALHERLNFDSLLLELEDTGYESQQLAVPLMIEVAPAQVKLMEANLDLFRKVGIEIESFGGNTFQITELCHLYEESNVCDIVYKMLDDIGQGNLFERENIMSDMLRFASRACKSSVRAGDRLTPQERRVLLEGFRRMRPPYTCPHGRPIIVELTQRQMEKSFRRIQ